MQQKTYTKQDIISSIHRLSLEKGRDIERRDFGFFGLPSVKTIERKFGSLSILRKELGLISDHRTGDIRSKTAKILNDRALKYNKKVYQELLKAFPVISIHKESSLTDDRRNRTDFKVFSKKIYFIDLFYPSDMKSLGGCVAGKIKKYPRKDLCFEEYQILFVNMNGNLKSADLRRKSPLPDMRMNVIDYKDMINFIK